MAEPMTMIGDAITDRAINTTANAINGLINMVITKGVDYFMGESKEERKKRLDQYYDKIKGIVDEHQRVTPLFTSNGEPIRPGEFRSPQQRAMQELDEIDGDLVKAVNLIEQAKEKSRCGVCKSKLEETLKVVKDTTVPIFDATDKIRAIQQLKLEGKLDPNALWEMLTPDQKKIVERLAKEYSKTREERAAAATMVITPLPRGPQMTGEEEVDIPKRTPRKPRTKASTPKASKRTSRATSKRASRKKNYPV